jgi:hypothetical protein
MYKHLDFHLERYNYEVNLPPIVVQTIAGIKVVRDDLLPGGSKRRFAYSYMLAYPQVEQWIYASPRQGYGQVALAYACRDLGKKAIVYVPQGKRTELTLEAEMVGAEINEVPMGYLTNLNRKAKDRQGHGWDKIKLVPFGFDDPIILNTIVETARKLPFTPKEVWSVMSSGTLSRGLQLAWPDAKVYGVQIGHNTSIVQQGRAITIPKRMPFHKDCKMEDRPPFPSSLTYDSKAWKHILERATLNEDTLFWNVGK